MVSRISGNRGPVSTGATTPQPPAVKAATKQKLLKQFEKLSTAGLVQYGNAPPAGVRFVRVPLKADRHPDGYAYTALIPVGSLKPGAKPLDPNKAKDFVIERSGGFAGITQYAGPFSISGKGQATDPFFSKFLDGSTRSGGGRAVTEKYPSDAEDGGGGGRVGGGGSIGTEKYPSDNEDGGGGRVGGGGGGVSTAKYPSDNEDSGGGGGRVGGGGGIATEKYPSDNEDGGGGGGGRVGGGGTIGTEKYPSDNEDGGGGRTGGGGRVGGGGNVFTEKYPSDNDE